VTINTDDSDPGALFPYRVMRGCSPPENPNTYAPTQRPSTAPTRAVTARPSQTPTIAVTKAAETNTTMVYGLGGALGAAVLSLAATVLFFNRRSKRLQEDLAIQKSFQLAKRTAETPGTRLSRWAAGRKQNRVAEGENEQEPQGNGFSRWTARLSQYRSGRPQPRGSAQQKEEVYNQGYRQGEDFHMSMNNPQFNGDGA
jgi:hypothetical protein